MARSDPPGPFIKLSSPETHEFWKIPILHEDEHLLALDKPSRLLVSPDRYDPNRPNLMKLLHRDVARRAPWAAERGITYLANAHRLDFETSGVLLLARNKPTLVKLANDFGGEAVSKEYLALVKGTPAEDEFDTGAKLGPHPTRPGLIRVEPKNGKRSHTRFKVIERFRGFALLRCFPSTGRTHQIRVHLKHLLFPILGDALYGGPPLLLSQIKRGFHLKEGKEEKPLIGRVGLHAAALLINHPVSGIRLKMESPEPHDLAVALKYLRKFAPA